MYFETLQPEKIFIVIYHTGKFNKIYLTLTLTLNYQQFEWINEKIGNINCHQLNTKGKQHVIFLNQKNKMSYLSNIHISNIFKKNWPFLGAYEIFQ